MATVLIVDDHAVNREFLLTLLGYSGHRLLEAVDGEQALAIARAEPPDLVITDILMPTMDGYEFVRQLRASPALARTKVIFYTAHYHGPEAAMLAARCGVDHTLTKPCEPEIILRAVASVLDGSPIPAVEQGEDFDVVHLELVTDKLAEKLEELERIAERLRRLVDVNLQLASEHDTHPLLKGVCDAARELVGAKYAVLVVTDRDGSRAQDLVASGMSPAVVAGLVPAEVCSGLVGEVVATRTVRVAANLSASVVATGLPACHPPIDSMLVAPIVSLAHCYGWLGLTEKLGATHFGDEDVQLLGILCAQLGRAYENSCLIRDLVSSDQRYRTIFDNTVLGIVAVDRLGQVVSLNPALVRMLGYLEESSIQGPRDRLIQHMYIDESDASRFLARLASEEKVEEFETRWRRADGAALWVALSARMIEHSDTIDISYIGMVEDITERIRLRDSMRERGMGLFHAQQMAKLAHVVTRADGSFESWSETLPQLADCAVDATPRTTRSWMRVVHPDDRANFQRRVIAAGRSRSRTEFEYRLNDRDGDLIYVRQTMEPLDAADATGGSRWFSTLQNISEQRRAEDRIKKLSRIYAVLSAINSAIVRIHDRKALCAEVCRIAVTEGAFKQAWIGEIDVDTMDLGVVASHSAGPAAAGLVGFSGRVTTPASENMPVFRAILEARTVICNHLDRQQLPVEATPAAAASLAAFPLIVGGRVAAVLSLVAPEAAFFDEEEVRLLTELAGDVALGLDYIAKVDQLDYLAYYDVLTGLPNSTLFHDRLGQVLHRAQHDHRPVALYLIDLDGFTRVNDTMGRHAGDILLKLVGERFRHALPDAAVLSRIGADTFAIAAADIGQDDNAAVALLRDRILDSLDDVFQLESGKLRITAHAGVALFPADGEDAETLFKNAEAALAKGKSSLQRCLFYAPDINSRMVQRTSLTSDFRVALESGQLAIHYQPIVELNGGQIAGMEALLRWQHPSQGLLSPASFLADIEDSDLAIPLGSWVMDNACAQTKAWQDAGLPRVLLTVNISARQFRDELFVQKVAATLRRTGLEPRWLGLELTEGIIMLDADQFIAKLDALKKLGVKLSLDDFGTGYSSLSYLKRFPLDQLKIDQSFIRDVTSSAGDAAIVRAVISVGHSMGLDVVAEGVETAAQLHWLRRHRCGKMQGYYFSRPLPAAEFDSVLRARKSIVFATGSANVDAKTLLIVDASGDATASVVRILQEDRYRMFTARSAAEALEILAMNQVQVILCDHRLPVMAGAEFLGKVRIMYPHTVRILFSDQVEMEALADAVNRGAVYRFLLKPWNDELLRESIREAFHYFWLTYQDPPAAEVMVLEAAG